MKAAKLTRAMKRHHASGGFGIEVLYPGQARNAGDSGFGALGRIDHAYVDEGTVVKMHPHRDDEILTYLRRGRVRHQDSVGSIEQLPDRRLMMMNAGDTFRHEETVIEGPLEGLQIFLRPRAADLEPQVQFHEFNAPRSFAAWRLIAGPRDAPLEVRAEAWVHDLSLVAGDEVALPPIVDAMMDGRLLYLFDGRVRVGDVTLDQGESLILEPGDASVAAIEASDLVLFTTDLAATVFRGGMFSGNPAHAGDAARPDRKGRVR